jgi:hypothetical protein
MKGTLPDMPRDIYDFAYASRKKVLQPTRNRPALLDLNDAGLPDALTRMRSVVKDGRLPREAWEAAHVA